MVIAWKFLAGIILMGLIINCVSYPTGPSMVETTALENKSVPLVHAIDSLTSTEQGKPITSTVGNEMIPSPLPVELQSEQNVTKKGAEITPEAILNKTTENQNTTLLAIPSADMGKSFNIIGIKVETATQDEKVTESVNVTTPSMKEDNISCENSTNSTKPCPTKVEAAIVPENNSIPGENIVDTRIGQAQENLNNESWNSSSKDPVNLAPNKSQSNVSNDVPELKARSRDEEDEDPNEVSYDDSPKNSSDDSIKPIFNETHADLREGPIINLEYEDNVKILASNSPDKYKTKAQWIQSLVILLLLLLIL